MRTRKKVKQRERHRKGEAGEGKREKVADRVELVRGGNKSHLFFLLVFFLLFFHHLVHKAPFDRTRGKNSKRESERKRGGGSALRRGIAPG